MSANWPWNELGLDSPSDKKSIMKAYSVRLKSMDRDDAEAFQRLQAARAFALSRTSETAPPKKPSMRQAGTNNWPGNGVETKSANGGVDLDAPDPSLASSNPPPPPPNNDTKPVMKAENELDDEEVVNQQLPPIVLPEEQQRSFWLDSKIETLWQDYQAAIDADQFDEAARVLARPEAQDREIRGKAELILIRHMRSKRSDFNFYNADLALFEDEFQWVSDSISLQKRAGYLPNLVLFQSELARLFNQRRFQQGAPKPPSEHKIEIAKPITITEILRLPRSQILIVSLVGAMIYLINYFTLRLFMPETDADAPASPDELATHIAGRIFMLITFYWLVIAFLQWLALMAVNAYSKRHMQSYGEKMVKLRQAYRKNRMHYLFVRGGLWVLVIMAVSIFVTLAPTLAYRTILFSMSFLF